MCDSPRITILPPNFSVVRPRTDETPQALLCLDCLSDPVDFQVETTCLVRVAKQDDIILGGYLLEPPEHALTWRILRLAVSPNARGQGLGYWLLGHAVGVAESRGAAEITINLSDSHPARNLFLRYGFEPVQSNRLSFFTYSE